MWDLLILQAGFLLKQQSAPPAELHISVQENWKAKQHLHHISHSLEYDMAQTSASVQPDDGHQGEDMEDNGWRRPTEKKPVNYEGWLCDKKKGLRVCESLLDVKSLR